MAKLQRIESSDSYSNAQIPQGSVLSFKALDNGKVVQKAKLSDGSIVIVAGGPGQSGAPAGFGTPSAAASTLEAGSAATAVVTASGPDTAKVFSFQFGIPRGPSGTPGGDGQDGAPGEAAGFGTPSATITMLDASDSATVSITASGPDTAKVFSFQFGIPRSSGIEFAQTTAEPSGNTVNVQPVTLDASGNATKDGNVLTVLYKWNLLSTRPLPADSVITGSSVSGPVSEGYVRIYFAESVKVTTGGTSTTYTSSPSRINLLAGEFRIEGAVSEINLINQTISSFNSFYSSTLRIANFSGMNNLVSISNIIINPELESLGLAGGTDIRDTSINLSAFSNLTAFGLQNNDYVTSIDVSAATNINSIQLGPNQNQNNLVLGGSAPSRLFVIGCNFTSNSLNSFASKLVAGGKTNGTFDCRNQATGETLTGQGLIDKQTLIDRGWTVSN